MCSMPPLECSRLSVAGSRIVFCCRSEMGLFNNAATGTRTGAMVQQGVCRRLICVALEVVTAMQQVIMLAW